MTTIHDLFPSRYVAAADLNGNDVTLTIRRHDVEDMFSQGKRVKKPVLYFEGEQKGMVLNKTNALTIAELYGETVEGWRGKPITLFAAEVDAFGKKAIAIRVRNKKPAPRTLKKDEIVARWQEQNDAAHGLGLTEWATDMPPFDADHPGRWWVETLDERADRIRRAFEELEQADSGEPADELV